MLVCACVVWHQRPERWLPVRCKQAKYTKVKNKKKVTAHYELFKKKKKIQKLKKVSAHDQLFIKKKYKN